MGLLDTIKDSISSIVPVTAGSRSAVGLDIGTSSIKVVQLRKEKGKALLETYGEIAIGPYASVESGRATHPSAESAVPAIKDLLREANVAALDAGVSIPFSAAMTRVIKVPRLGKEQLSKIIPIEARKFIPMPLNEVVLNWFIIPERPGPQAQESTRSLNVFNKDKNIDFQDALIVAIHKDAVANMQSIARQTDLQVSFFELETFSAIRSSVEYELSSTMLLDIGATSSKVYVVEAGVLHFSHLINLGAQNITENIMRSFTWPFEKAERVKKEIGLNKNSAMSVFDEKDRLMFEQVVENAVNRIFTELNRVMIGYEKKNNKPISRVVLSGGGANMHGILDFAVKKLSVDVLKADPFAKVHAPAFLNDVLKGIGPDFAVATGLALRRLESN